MERTRGYGKAWRLMWDRDDWSLAWRVGEHAWHVLFGLRCGLCLRWSFGCRQHWFCGICVACHDASDF